MKVLRSEQSVAGEAPKATNRSLKQQLLPYLATIPLFREGLARVARGATTVSRRWPRAFRALVRPDSPMARNLASSSLRLVVIWGRLLSPLPASRPSCVLPCGRSFVTATATKIVTMRLPPSRHLRMQVPSQDAVGGDGGVAKSWRLGGKRGPRSHPISAR
jgi:hypothetical protein